MPFKVMIIGAGLSGGLLANGLLTHSTPNEIEVIVFEREEATHAREGYQIRLGAAAVKGMRACLSEDMKMEICRKFGRSGGVMASAPILYDGVDMSVKSDWSKFPEYTKSAPISRSVLRSVLSAPLKEQGVVRFGKKFVSYEVRGDGGPDGREQVVAKFADGTEEVGDVLIAADGASSPVNSWIPRSISYNHSNQIFRPTFKSGLIIIV
jgi:2-polyprenyl-6-methoxyphenol hydroxylase-like FAD-dependent oxidoreductase